MASLPPTIPARPALKFGSLDEAVSYARSLLGNGYTPLGRWTLGQNCEHLGLLIRCSLDGFPSWHLPELLAWPIRTFALSEKQLAKPMPRNLPTPPGSRPATDSASDEAGVELFAAEAGRLAAHEGPMHRSPMFGRLSPELWRKVHLKHAEHHLGFLTPKEV